MEPPSYVVRYLATSGLNPTGGLAQGLKCMMTILWMMVCFDRVDALDVAAAERVARRALMKQRAVHCNPQASDFDGLEFFRASTLARHGGVATLEFEKHVAEAQKAEAQVFKQQRMSREEARAVEKNKTGKGATGGGRGSGAAPVKDGQAPAGGRVVGPGMPPPSFWSCGSFLLRWAFQFRAKRCRLSRRPSRAHRRWPRCAPMSIPAWRSSLAGQPAWTETSMMLVGP